MEALHVYQDCAGLSQAEASGSSEAIDVDRGPLYGVLPDQDWEGDHGASEADDAVFADGVDHTVGLSHGTAGAGTGSVVMLYIDGYHSTKSFLRSTNHSFFIPTCTTLQ